MEASQAKMILGVHKKASSVGARGELGMLPLNTGIYVRILKYYSRLIELIKCDNGLIKAAMEECFGLCSDNYLCWLTTVINLFKFLNIDINVENYKEQFTTSLIDKLKKKLTSSYKDLFMDHIIHSVKLNLYSGVKTEFGQKSYISQVQYYKYGRAITKFRISVHSFRIQRGQWDKIERKERFVHSVLETG